MVDMESRYLLILDTAVFAIITILITFFYCRSASLIKSYSRIMRSAIQIRLRDVYIYSFLPLIHLGVGQSSTYFFDVCLFSSCSEQEWQVLSIVIEIAQCLVGLTGFTNTMVFFVQRMKSSEEGNRTSIERLESLIREKISRDSVQILLTAAANDRL